MNILASDVAIILQDLRLQGVDVSDPSQRGRVMTDLERVEGRSFPELTFNWKIVDQEGLENGERWLMVDVYEGGKHLCGNGDVFHDIDRSSYWGPHITMGPGRRYAWKDTIENAADAVAEDAYELYKESGARLTSKDPQIAKAGAKKSLEAIEFLYVERGAKLEFVVRTVKDHRDFAVYDMKAKSIRSRGAKRLVAKTALGG